jgi:multidrug efflux pump subunit AcrB
VILHRAITLSVAGAIIACAAVLFMFVGTDCFPEIDAGQMTLHVRAAPGMRIESAE